MMPLLSFLSFFPVLGFVYTICFVVREERAMWSGGIAPSAVSPQLDSPVRENLFSGKRQIKWISAKELKALSRQSDNLVLIALRRKTEAKPIPFPESHVLYMEPGRLVDLLEWLPPTCGAVLYGAYGRLSSTVTALRNLAGRAPIYVVCETSFHSGSHLDSITKTRSKD